MRAIFGAAIGAAACLSSACSLLVGGEMTPLHCSEEGQLGPPACDAGFVCRAGVCQLAPAPAADGGQGGENGSPGGASGVAGAGGAAR